MTHPAVIKSHQLVVAGDLLGAEHALAEIAETEGDTALVAVLDQVAPKDLLAIMREFDGSRESIINMVVTPEQFAQAVVLEKRYGEKGHERLRGMVNAVLYRDEDLATEYLEAVGDKDGGLVILIDYFSDRVDELFEFVKTGELQLDFTPPEPTEVASVTWLVEKIDEVDEALQDGDALMNSRPKQSRAEISDHDWMETAWLLRYEMPDLFEELIIALRDRLARQLESIHTQERAPDRTSDANAVSDEETEEESAI